MWRSSESAETTVNLGKLIVEVSVRESYVTNLTITFFSAPIGPKKKRPDSCESGL